VSQGKCEIGSVANFKDIKGQAYGRLTVLGIAFQRKQQAYWHCRCECGKERTICGGALRSGHSRSCGCIKSNNVKTHGMTKSPEYKAWASMKARCLRPSCERYRNYGGRGISICERWVDSFEAFYKDMGPCNGMTLERKNVNLGYAPDNCIWLPAKGQYLNRTDSRIIDGCGKRLNLSTWATAIGMDISLLSFHLRKERGVEQIWRSRNPNTSIDVLVERLAEYESR